MIPLSTRAKEAIKVGLALVIVYAIAMQMGWDKPYWAGFTVVTINVLSAGVSLTRGVTRTLGTLVGAVAGLAIMGLFPQERWWLMVCVSLYVGFCTYMLTGKHQSYFWFLASFTCLIIIGVSSPPESQSAFQTAALRTQETALGALVYLLVAVFLWPRSSVGLFNDASRKLWATQAQLFRTYRELMAGKGTAEGSRPLRLQEIQQQAQVGQLLNAAESDSYAVWELRHQWRQFRDQSMSLMETLERWRQSFAEVQSLNLNKLLPNLQAVCSELDRRFEQIGRMLAGEAPTQAAQAITLTVAKDQMRALTRFQEAAVVVTQVQLESLERISRSLFDCVADIRGFTRQAAAPAGKPARRRSLAIDPDRFRAVVRVLVTLWLGFLLWVYVNPPGHSAFAMMAGIFALIIAMVPQASPSLLFLSWGGGVAFAGVLYIFVMPHLSGFAELAVLLFGAFFVMQYLLGEPRHVVARMFTMASFLILISIDNQQTYSFSDYANDVLWIMLSLALAVATAYFPTSPHPEKVFLRLLRRFFRHAEFLSSGLAPDGQQQKPIARRLKSLVYRNDLLELPGKLAACGKQIDYRVFPDNTPEQVQALVASLYALAYRINDLAEARGYPQAERVEKRLLDDLLVWHHFIESRLRRRAEDPTQFIEPIADVRERFAARLAGLEVSIKEIFAQSGEAALSTADYKNLYRLLGSYRGLSEAAIGYAQLAEGINWAPWREARF
jgi:uncharacterized membrane protein YccC